MQISQENGNTGSGAGAATYQWYTADQWWVVVDTSPTGTSATQRVQVTTSNGSKDRLRVQVVAAKASLAAGNYLQIVQNIEGGRVADFLYGAASARKAVLRFGFKGPAGTYSFYLQNSASNRSYIGQFTLGSSNVDTEFVFSIPGDTTGTWLTDTGKGIVLGVIIAGGTTYQGVAGWQAGNLFVTAANSNGMASAGAIFELYDVGLYLDKNNTGLPPPWQMPDEAQEMVACRRYWETGAFGMNGHSAAASIPWTWRVALQTNKRALPAMASTGVTPGNCVLTALDTPSGDSVRVYITNTAAGAFNIVGNYQASARM